MQNFGLYTGFILPVNPSSYRANITGLVSASSNTIFSANARLRRVEIIPTNNAITTLLVNITYATGATVHQFMRTDKEFVMGITNNTPAITQVTIIENQGVAVDLILNLRSN